MKCHLAFPATFLPLALLVKDEFPLIVGEVLPQLPLLKSGLVLAFPAM